MLAKNSPLFNINFDDTTQSKSTQVTHCTKKNNNQKYDINKIGKGLFNVDEPIQYIIPEKIPEKQHSKCINRDKLLSLDISDEQEEKTQQSVNRTLLKLKLDQLLQNKMKFCSTSVKEGKILSSLVVKKPLLNVFSYQYDMIFFDEKAHIMSSKKKLTSTGANYYISISQDTIGQKDTYHIGQIKTGKDSCRYNIFRNINKQLVATIVFGKSVQLYLLNSQVRAHELEGSNNQNIGLDYLYRFINNLSKITLYSNKKPSFNPEKRCYYLNFSGRVTQPSQKNIIMQNPQTNEEVLMFGKVKNSIYRLDICQPLSPFIGFAMIIGIFQFK